MNETKQKTNQVLTIPNILSMVRIALIPVIVWLYHIKGEYLLAAGVLVISGVTDIVDGFIARRFHMISDLGKILDPIADKLTQTAVLVCLLFRFPLMGVPLALLVVKEFVSGIWRLIIIRQTGEVKSAQWHGKAATVLLYSMLQMHILWTAIPTAVSVLSIIACSVMMLVSFALYSMENYRAQKKAFTHP